MSDVYLAMAYYGERVLIASLVGLLVLLLARRSPASVRNFIAVTSLFALLALPFLVRLTPHRYVRVNPIISRPFLYVQYPQTALSSAAHEYAVTPGVPTAIGQKVDYGTSALAAIYVVVAAWFCIRLALGFLRVAKRVNECTPIQSGVLACKNVTVPMAVWAGKAAILVPLDFEQWELERQQRVLAHERAHLARKDLLWNLIGQVSCALYWPLPTVWAIQRMARESSERSCDDLVLRQGTLPTDYAQDLLEIAKDVSQRFPAPGLPIAIKAEVGKRIAHILDGGAKRGAASRAARLTTVVFAFAICAPFAMYAIAETPEQFGFVTVEQRPSLQTPGAIQGTPDNNFVGTMSDGRKIELLQIQHKGKNGFEAWKPDGTPITNPKPYGGLWWLDRSDHIEMVFRFQTPSKDPRIDSNVLPGPFFAGEKPSPGGKGGMTLPADGSGWRIAISRPELPNPGSARCSFVFMYQTEDLSPLFSVIPTAHGLEANAKDGPFAPLTNLRYRAVDSEETSVLDGHLLTDKSGNPKTRIAKGWSFSYDLKGYSPIELVLTVHDKKGASYYPTSVREYGYIKNDPQNGFHQSVLIEQPIKDVGSIEVQRRDAQAVEFIHVVVRPDLLG